MSRHSWTKTLLIAASTLGARPAVAAPKPLVDYFLPIPIVGKLSTTVWGASTVGARDPATGLEDNGANGGALPQQEQNYFWDGKIVKGEDGKYHIYASHWAHGNGFGGWGQPIPAQAISDDVIGPYVVQKDCYTQNSQGNNKGHNVTAVVAPSGANPFTLSVGEIVPGQMFTSSSANGPFTLAGTTQTNSNGHNCGSLSSNFTLTVGPSNRFWATSRGGCVMDSDQVLGPYKVETNSVLPNLENNDNGDAEDEVIWYSGGYFHIVYNYWNVRRAYHIMSKDGLSNWQSTGLAYEGKQSSPNANSDWVRYSDGTVNHWYNVERPGVLLENGHVTHFSFAVTDLDKDTASQINSGGSKVLVVPFNGAQFDCDNGDTPSCQDAASGGSGGSSAGGAAGNAGQSGAGTAGTPTMGGGAGGTTTGAGAGGSEAIGGATVGAGGSPAAGGGAGGTTSSVAGSPTAAAGTATSAGTRSLAATGPNDGGCGCRVSTSNRTDRMSWVALAAASAVAVRRRARRGRHNGVAS